MTGRRALLTAAGRRRSSGGGGGGSNLLTGDAATFDSGIADWNKTTGGGNFDLAWSSADGGVLSAAVTTGGSNIAVASGPNNGAKPGVTPGATLTFSAKTKQLSGTARSWRLQADFYDASDSSVSSNNTVVTGTTTVGSYATLSGDLAVPASAAMVRMRVRWDTPAAGETFYLDDASIVST